MYYKLKDEVFLVHGAYYSCIYHLPNNELYQIDKETYDFVSNCLSRDVTSEEEINALDELIQMNVLEKSSKIENRTDIDDYLKQDRPFSFVWIELTNICNLKCIHCYNEKSNIKKTTLALPDFIHIVDEISEHKIKKVQLIGGEPYVMDRKKLLSMMDYLSPRVTNFELFINGTLTNENDLYEIKKRYPNASLATSLHSYIEKEHEKVTCVSGSFKKTISTIRNANQIGIPIRHVGTLISGIEIGDEMDFGKPSRRDFVRLSGRASLKLYNKALLKEKAIIKDNFIFSNLKGRLLDCYTNSCYATHLYISSNMNVYPCPMERRLCHGNLKNNSLNDILKESILALSKKDINECRDCEYRYICLDCRPDSIDNNITEKPWFCTYNPLNGQWTDFDKFAENLGITD